LFGTKDGQRKLDFDMEEPKITWFKNAKLNITKNCLDRHLNLRGEKTAIIWEPTILTKKRNTSLTKTSTKEFAKWQTFLQIRHQKRR
jgi:acyl-coenzyme A synthetase/AMP-(fatty) acid ligase